MTLLNVQNLSIHFGASAAVRDVSLTVNKGELLALVGESGSGKSLTALSILKLLPPEARVAGSVALNDEQISALSEKSIAHIRGNNIGMIFQEPMTALNPLHPIDRQILEPLRVHQKLSDAQANEKLAALYEAVGLSYLSQRGTRYPHQLSGGERQRVMIAIATACNPDLLIADEPTTALDVSLQIQVLHLLKKLQTERGMGILLITHDLNVVRKIADRVAVMRHGEIVETATTAELFSNPQHAYTRMLINAHPKGVPAPIPPEAPEILNATLRVDFPIKSGILQRITRVTTAVNDVTLKLRAGETLGIVGESGSGKSSLAFALLKLIKSTGPIVFMGRRIDELSQSQFRPLRRSLQIVFQDPYSSMNPRMTVGAIVMEGLKVYGIRDWGLGIREEESDANPQNPKPKTQSRLSEILLQVGLDPAMAERYSHEFSGGQRQRIAIARAMILRPALVLLDEPTSALDMSVQAQVIDLLRDMQTQFGTAYLFISHDLRTVRAMSHRVLVMQRGAVVETGTAEQIFNNPQHAYTSTLMHAAFGETLT
jgi:microcin C transport system ATP-binding protein